MKRYGIIILLFCVFLISAFGQERTLVLFVSADSSRQGVQDDNGHIVIPAEYLFTGSWSVGDTIEDSIFDFYGLPKGVEFPFDSLRVAYTGNTTFDRSGKVLYHPFLFDNGGDYIVEGARRFVDISTGKMGLVHPYGKVLIPAKYDFLTPLSGGYTTAYTGVKRLLWEGEEHWSVVRDSSKQYSCVVLDRWGGEVTGKKSRDKVGMVQNEKDSLYYPAVYVPKDAKEKDLLDALQLNNDFRYLGGRFNEKWQLSIIERPSEAFPYYVIDVKSPVLPMYILVDTNRQFYYFDYMQPKQLLRDYVQTIRNER